MKKEKLRRILLIEFIICLLLSLFGPKLLNVYSWLAFPLKQIADVLRKLSLSGTAGNAFAIILYVVIALLPIFVLGAQSKKRSIEWKDTLLILASILLFAGIYHSINPGNTARNLPASNPDAVAIIYNMTLFSVIISYIVLRFLQSFVDAKTEMLHQYFAWLLSALAIGSLACAFFFATQELQNLWIQIAQNEIMDFNIVQIDPHRAEKIFILIRSVIISLPYLINMVLAYYAMGLVEELNLNRYSEKVVALSGKLFELSSYALGILIFSNIFYNLYQLINRSKLQNINAHVFFPISSTLFVLGILLFTKYIEEGRRIKEDNDLFV